MDPKSIIIEHTYVAPLEKVWRAITDKGQMKHWYFEIMEFKAEVGFEFQFYGGSEEKKYLHKCRVVEVDPITKISYSWGYDGYVGRSLVTFELSRESGNRTRLKLTHSGLESFPKDNPDLAAENFKQGWMGILGESLRVFVETEDFAKSIRIYASPEDIWDVVLKPDNQWGTAFGDGAYVETDWKEGSPIIWRDTENNIGANGIVEVHRPEEYLQLNYYDEVEPEPGDNLGDYCEKIRLEIDGGAKVLSIEIGKLPRGHITVHQEMWDRALALIKELAEKG